MQDRFKFKHWDKQINKMRYGDIQLGNNGKPFVIVDNIENPIEDIEDVITLQCTGLKDKNGKLIYEGDIVLGSWKTKLIVIYDVFSSRFMLKTIKGQASEIAYYTCFDTQGEDIYCKNLEILGNIYENKDLLAKDTTNE